VKSAFLCNKKSTGGRADLAIALIKSGAWQKMTETNKTPRRTQVKNEKKGMSRPNSVTKRRRWSECLV